ncbi:MAG: hypothetical protein HC858_09760, partial [Brachymonas sp.]|nr:hypothetical protein [Brachymonas sp.]
MTWLIGLIYFLGTWFALLLSSCAQAQDSSSWQWHQSHEVQLYATAGRSSAKQQAQLRWLPMLQAQRDDGHSLRVQADLQTDQQ